MPIRYAPWVASVRIFGTHFCGGAIVSPKHVITCAQCRSTPDVFIYSVFAGSSIFWADKHSITSPVLHFIIHHAYDPRTLVNDIAVITLQIAIRLNGDTLAAASLPVRGAITQPGTTGWIAGWYFFVIINKRIFEIRFCA